MLLWISAAALTLAACLAVLRPMLRPAERGDGHAHDLEVYRDQLAEIDRDRARGLLAEAEAVEARAEVGRRILRIADMKATTSGRSGGVVRWTALAVVLFVPLSAWILYSGVGAPGIPDQPLAARLNAAPQSGTIEELVARAERHLIENPADARGWAVLAPIYLRMGRTAESVTAYRNALRLAGPDPRNEAGLGEALMAQAGGVVTAEARAAFERAGRLDPEDPKAAYYVALADAQAGRGEAATAAWSAMLAKLPADSPWRDPVERAIAANGAQTAGAPGPTRDDLAAAANLSPEERAEMIEGMVARLDERLRDDPSDAEGWLRLVRSYMMLDRPASAQEAFDRGRSALASDAQGLRTLTALGRSFGLTSTE